MSVSVAVLLALSLATAREPDEAPLLEEPEGGVGAAAEEAEEAEDAEDLDVARVAPEPPAGLPAAPRGVRLADAAPLLLERMERPDGTALERLVEPNGDVVLHEVSRAGTVLSCRTVGRLHTMRVLEQREAAGGEVIQVARDASGALLRYVVGADGEPRALTLVAPAPR